MISINWEHKIRKKGWKIREVREKQRTLEAETKAHPNKIHLSFIITTIHHHKFQLSTIKPTTHNQNNNNSRRKTQTEQTDRRRNEVEAPANLTVDSGRNRSHHRRRSPFFSRRTVLSLPSRPTAFSLTVDLLSLSLTTCSFTFSLS
jgi:hypothetical protein